MAEQETFFYTFSRFRFDPRAKVLTHGGEIVPLPHKAQQVLAALLARRGEIVSKDELLGEVWRDTFVEEGNLSVHVHTLRKTLARLDPARQSYIQTVKGYGFRFVPEVRKVAADAANSVFGSRGQSGVPETIAVLPFSAPRSGGEEEFLCIGLTDAVAVKLSRTGRFVVRQTRETGAGEDEDEDAAATGRRLSADAVLRGKVRRGLNGRLRVAVRLVGAEGGTILWAEEFDVKLMNILDVEDSISERIVGALRLKLRRDERRQMLKRHTENTEAHLDYLKGRFFWSKRTPGNVRSAIKYFERALAKDPDYAPAYTGLADSYNHLGHQGAMPVADVKERMKAAITRALELDEQSAETHASLAGFLMDYEWDWAGAEREFRRAVELNPNHIWARQGYAELLSVLGRHEAAAAEIKRARSLDPLSLIVNAEVGRRLYFEREYEGAIQELLDAREMDPNFTWTNLYLMQAYAEAGDYTAAESLHEESERAGGAGPLMLATLCYVRARSGDAHGARRVLTKLGRMASRSPVSPTYVAFGHVALGEMDAALGHIENALAARSDPHLQFINVYPQLDALRANSHFRVLLRRMGLAGD